MGVLGAPYSTRWLTCHFGLLAGLCGIKRRTEPRAGAWASIAARKVPTSARPVPITSRPAIPRALEWWAMAQVRPALVHKGMRATWMQLIPSTASWEWILPTWRENEMVRVSLVFCFSRALRSVHYRVFARVDQGKVNTSSLVPRSTRARLHKYIVKWYCNVSLRDVVRAFKRVVNHDSVVGVHCDECE